MTEHDNTLQKRRWLHILLTLLVIAVVNLALYGRTIAFDFTRTDDSSLIINRATFLENISNLPTVFSQSFFTSKRQGEGYYRPLVTTSFMLDAQIGGINPWIFHLTNLLLHIATCWLLFVLFTKFKVDRISSLIACLIFAVHPVNVEAICWIPGRTDILLAFFSLLSVLFFLNYIEQPRWKTILAHIFFFWMALLSKESAIVLPAICFSYYTFFFGVKRSTRDLRLLTSWLASIIIYLIIWISVIIRTPSAWRDRITVFLNQTPAIAMHMGKIIIPYRLSTLAIYQDTPYIVGLILLALILLTAITWILTTSKREGPHETCFSMRPHLGLFILGIIWFSLPILPTLAVSDYMILENRLYMSTIGVLLSLIALSAYAIEKIKHPLRGKILGILFAVIVCLFSYKSIIYSASFRNADTFTANAIKNSPDCALAHLNRGVMQYRAGFIKQAKHEFLIAWKLNKDQPNLAGNLGSIFLKQKEYKKAETMLRLEIKRSPNSATAHFSLGLSLLGQNLKKEAYTSFQKAIQLDHDRANALIKKHIEYYETHNNQAEADWFKSEFGC